MSFQAAVNFRYTTGFVGEAQADVPTKARVWRLSAQTAIPNTVGKAFTYDSEQLPIVGNQGTLVAAPGGAGKFAGILIHPKHYALYGTPAGGPLAPSLDLPPSSEAELLTSGNVIVWLSAAAAYGDTVYFVASTGDISTVATGNTQIVGASVLTPIAAAGPAVINLVG